VLARARRGGRPHPTVALLAEAGILALRLVGAGRFEPGDGRWLPSALDPDEDERVRRLAAEASYDAWSPSAAESAVHDLVAAVVDALPRGTPGALTSTFRRRLDAELVRPRPTGSGGAGLPALVTISLRVEADEEELVAGSVRLVLQVHDELDPLHLCDAALLWTGTPEDHGFGDRARTHAAIALRAAAHAWPVLDRLLELRVPDEITLDTDELVSLLDDGVAALRRVGVDVLWPRSLGRDLTTRAALEHRDERAQEGPLMTGLFGPDAMFAFKWQVALHGEPLSDAEMRQLATAASPVLKLRGAWTVVDPQVARKAKKRLIRTITPVQAVAAALTGTVEVEEGEAEVIVGASLLKVRERLLGAATRDPLAAPAALRATLRDYQRHGLTWLDQLTTLGLGCCLADDMGLGKTITVIALHLHRLESSSEQAPTDPRRLPRLAARQLGGRDRAVRAGHARAPFPRRSPVAGGPRGRAPGTDPGFVLTTYGTLRSDHGTRDASGPRLRDVTWGLVVADEAQHVKNAASAAARALRAIPGTARVALTGTPVENNLSELWAILDWAIPGLLGSRNASARSGRRPSSRACTRRRPTVRRPGRPVRAAPQEVRPGHRAGAAAEDRDRPPARADPRAGGAVRGVRARHDGAHRARRRGDPTRPGARAAHGLKQICNHPAQFLKQSGAVRLTGRSHKLDLLDELLTTILAEGGAALVFTQYVAMARLARGPPRPRGHRATSSSTAARPCADGTRWSGASRPARCRCSCCR
jgi:hypothetical protein